MKKRKKTHHVRTALLLILLLLIVVTALSLTGLWDIFPRPAEEVHTQQTEEINEPTDEADFFG